jgi:hypothetical protein
MAHTTGMSLFDDGTGPALYMCLRHDQFGHMVRWRGTTWEVINDGIPPWRYLHSPIILDDGGGPRLYAFGRNISGIGYWLVRWDGQRWEETLPGMVTNLQGPALSIDLGNGPAIYGANFDLNLGHTFLRWDNGSWTPIGTGLGGLYSFDFGTGPGLYIIGRVDLPGGSINGIARWAGTEWIDLSSPGWSIIDFGRDAVVFDDGTGPALYTTTHMNRAGEPTQGLRKWLGPGPGGGWQYVGGPIEGPGAIFHCKTLHIFDDGRGPAIYMSGGFTNINNVPARSLARYDGHTWEGVGAGLSGGGALSMGSINTPHGPTLLISGDFVRAHGGIAPDLVMLVGCPGCPANCDGSTIPPILNIDDFTCFINKFAAQDPYANCNDSFNFPYFNIDDFTCFINRFAAGCP